MSPETPPSYDSFLAPVRPEERSWWRLGVWGAASVALGALVLVATILVIQTLDLTLPADQAALPAYLLGPARLYRTGVLIALDTVLEVAAITAVLFATRWTWKRSLESFLTPLGPFNARLLGLGALSVAVPFAAAWGIDVATHQATVPAVLDPSVEIAQRGAYGAVIAISMLAVAFVEEALFRGVILQISSAFLKSRVALCLLNGLLFSCLHFDNDLAAIYERFLMGAVFTWATLELGGLEFAVGAHFLNNAAILLFTGPSAAAPAPEPVFDPQSLILPSVNAVVALGLVWVAKRWRLRSKV